MDIYEKLNLNVAPGKEQPGVWVSRLILFEKLSPGPVIIREVKLSRGLNIVWAQEPDDDNTTTEIKGHSAGKTSFCRLLRYVLGEKTFGTKANQKLIQSDLPDGYVGAELHVMGKPWAAIRPFDTARRSYARADVSVEALIAERRAALGHEEYVNQLGLAKLLDALETATVVRSTQSIEWDHVLAWCTRDQEARFQNIHEWRSTRSESDWPAFKASKADALFVMRTVLGLFLPDELKQEEELAGRQRLKEATSARVAELEREPQFRVNLYTNNLRSKLADAYPGIVGIEDVPLQSEELKPDLTRLTEDAAKRFANEIQQAERDEADTQSQIDDLGAEIARLELEQRMLSAASGVADAGSAEVAAGLGEAQKLRSDLAQHGHKTCPFGGVIINKCEYVVARLGNLSLPRLQDAQVLEQAETEREADQQTADEQETSLDRELVDLRQRRSGMLKRRQQSTTRMAELRHARQELLDTLASLVGWVAKQSDPAAFKELDDARERLGKVTEEIEEGEQTLVSLLKQHDSSRDHITSIFSEAVRSVLSSGTYDGRVSLDNRELRFYIEHGTAMSGEAIETLSVLLADLACMVYNSTSERVLLPGLLLHDSPREADLSRRVYRSFIRFVASLQSHFGSTDACPFQYIITTTTDPPDELRADDFVKLHLNAGSSEELLFRRSLAATDSSSTAGSADDDSMFGPENTGGLDG